MSLKLRAPVRFWTGDEDNQLRALHGTIPIPEIAARLGRTRGSVRGRITKIGIGKWAPYPEEMLAEIRELYESAGENGAIHLSALARKWGKNPANVNRAARTLGLPVNQRRRKSNEPRKDRRKFKGDSEALRAAMPQVARDRIAKHGHPRGMLGKKHKAEVLARLSESSRGWWAGLTEEQRLAHTQKAVDTVRANGTSLPGERARGSWKAGWREIGGKRNYYRSRWEANYARWLETLKQQGIIVDWEFEPRTFWFDGIKRGVRSYKPDFRVTGGTSSDSITWHEVKGWMDARSKTTLRRMGKYHPDEIVILIDSRRYAQLEKNCRHAIDGWEQA